MGKYLLRGLSDRFLNDLKDGELEPYLKLVQNDRTLELDIRDNKIYVFYRGGALYIISPNQDANGYRFKNAFLDSIGNKVRNSSEIFSGGFWAKKAMALYNGSEYFEAIPYLKSVIDNHLCVIGGNDEKEFQQLLVRANNQLSSPSPPKADSVSLYTDYYFVGLEYQLFDTLEAKIDLIAVRYDTKKRNTSIGKVVLVEVKLGTGSFGGTSGIQKHISDVEKFFDNEAYVDILKKEAVTIFQQKHLLGLIDSAKPIEAISDEKPEFILVLADATSNGEAVEKSLTPFQEPFANFDLKIATSSAMGYALYANRMLTVKKFLAILNEIKIPPR